MANKAIEPANDQIPSWRQMEMLVAEIQTLLAPGATVSHNVMLPGHDSETNRQIDVLVQQSVGQFPITIVIDCKDYAKPVDLKGIEEFEGMVRDVRAHQGSIVSAKGFTQSAKTRARKANIGIYSLIDTEPHKWQTKQKLALPAECIFRTAGIGFEIVSSHMYPMMLREDFLKTLLAFDANGAQLGYARPMAFEKWNGGHYPIEPGEHRVPLFASPEVHVDNGYGKRVPVTMFVMLDVKAQRFFGRLSLEKVRGLLDEQTGMVTTNAFSFAEITPAEVENTWQRLTDDEDPPQPIAIRFDGLVGFEVDQT